MSLFFWKKKHSEAPSTLTAAPASGFASSQVTQQLQFPTNSPSHLQHPVCPWSAHAPPSRQSLSPLLRYFHTLSMSAAGGELILFGGCLRSSKCPSNDLYIISTRNFSTTLLETSGDVPSPRYGHAAVLTSSNTLLIWGGRTGQQDAQDQTNDDSFYLLNFVSREWTRIVVNGPGPGGRYFHSMTLVGSKLFVFGGWSFESLRYLNDIWALDLNYLKSNPFWESYGPVRRKEKPLPRVSHVSVTTGDRIIIFGGSDDSHVFEDTWSFNTSTRKWTELQCTGSFPLPRTGHAAVLIDDLMYVYGCPWGIDGKTNLHDLTVLNLSTQQWTTTPVLGLSPSVRSCHAMACDGTYVFVIGGELSPGVQVDEAKLIYVLDTKLLNFPKPYSYTVKHSAKTTQLAQKLPVDHPIQGQPQDRILSSSDVGALRGAFPSQIATFEDMGRPTSPQFTREQNPSLKGLPSQPTGVDDKARQVPQEDDDTESSTERHAEVVAPDAPPEYEATRLERERIADLERQLTEILAAQTERDRHIAQLTDQLAQMRALFERAEANATEAKNNVGRELQAKLDELMLSRDEHLRTLEQAQRSLQKATSHAPEADERSQVVCQHEAELAEVRAELEGKKSELEAVHLRLVDTENGYTKSTAEADAYNNQNATGRVNTDEDRVVHRLMKRVQAMEAEIASLRWKEKSFEMIECRNED